MVINWITRNITKMVPKIGLEIWKTKLTNCEVTPPAIWPFPKSLSKCGGPLAPSAIHGQLSTIFIQSIKPT
jgi:hypothetical protein